MQSFNDQPADGRVLVVKIVGGTNATLGGRLGAAVGDSVDVLMDDSAGSSYVSYLKRCRCELFADQSIGNSVRMTSSRKIRAPQSWLRHLVPTRRITRRVLRGVEAEEVVGGDEDEEGEVEVVLAWMSTNCRLLPLRMDNFYHLTAFLQSFLLPVVYKPLYFVSFPSRVYCRCISSIHPDSFE